MRWTLAALAATTLALAACGSDESTPPDATVTAPDGATAGPDGAAPAALALAIEPRDATLEVPAGTQPELRFRVSARLADGTTRADVPAAMGFDVAGAGAFRGTTFVASGAAGGAGTVTAAWGGARTTAVLVVRLRAVRAGAGVAGDLAARAAERVPSAADDPALRPAIAYPEDGTVMPPNVNAVEWQWRPVAGADLYVTTFESPVAVLHHVSRESRVTLSPDDWRAVVASNRGRAVTVTVRAARSADLGRAGASAVRVTLGPQDLAGGIYYFTTDEGEAAQGIFRYDFGVPGSATRFLSPRTAGGCVGCHALSRDGARMLVTYETGAGALAAFDVRTPGRPLFGGARGPQRGAFAAFFDEGRSFLAVHDDMEANPGDRYNGQLRVFDTATGRADDARQVPIGAGHRATHVDVAPDGLTAAYVDYADTAARPIRMTLGTIRVTRYDPARRTWSAPRTLVASEGGVNNYYPSFSPDGQWVLFNRARGSSYDNAAASVWVVPADGSRPAVELARANRAAMLTNSWPRWAPFVQRDELGTARLWFTFSSKRDYGLRLVGARRPQVWMAAFAPAEAAAGRDPSAPAFWLPFQDLATRNHTASWTERVVERNCERDSDCMDPTQRCNPTRRTCEEIPPPG